jgi:hypothetical protein
MSFKLIWYIVSFNSEFLCWLFSGWLIFVRVGHLSHPYLLCWGLSLYVYLYLFYEIWCADVWCTYVYDCYILFTYCSLFFFVILEFELRTSCLLGRCSTVWAILPAFFALVIFEIGSRFLPTLAWIVVLLVYSCCITGVTSACHHAQLFSVEMESCRVFVWAGLELQSSQLQPPTVGCGWDDSCKLLCPVLIEMDPLS